MHKSIKYALVIVILLIIVVGGYYFIDKTLTANAIKEARIAELRIENYEDWLGENCKCLESNRYFCEKGSEIRDNFCVNSELKTFTYQLQGCSKYDCAGEVRSFNFNESKWDIPEDFVN